MSENTKTPRIRFKGFTDAWEQRKFKESVEIERGGSPRPINDYITNEPNGLNWIKIGDAPEQGNVIVKTAEKIKPSGLSKTRQVQIGDLILSNSMSFGKPYIMGINGCIHDGWLLIRDVQGAFDLIFLCQLLGTDQMLKQYKARAAGSTVNNLNKELVGNTLITVPTKCEQHKLGGLFQKLDDLITLHQRKCDKLKNIKAALLEKMFPQGEAATPKIRFKGFTDAWEQCELGKIANEVTRTDPESTAPIMMITANNGFIEQSDRYAFDNAGESLKKYILLEKGELAYNHGASKLRPYGSCFALTTVEKARIPFVYHCFSAKNYNSEFLSIELNGENVEKQLRRIVSSGARMDGLLNISFTEYSTITLSLPKRKEQDKISNFFSILDNLITLHQRKVEKLKNIKSALLEKMFV